MIEIEFEQSINSLKFIIIGLLSLWKIWIIFGLIIFIKLIPYYWERYQLSKSGILEIDKIDGKDFEKFLQIKFEELGYKVDRTKYVKDNGADLVIEKNGVKTVVQAKRYSGNVGIKAVQEVVSSKNVYDCEKAMVVTNSYFTQEAKFLANTNHVELWDRKELCRQLLNIKEKGNNISAPETEHPKRICVTCQAYVNDKVYNYCLENPQLFNGKIYCYKHQKKIDIMYQR